MGKNNLVRQKEMLTNYRKFGHFLPILILIEFEKCSVVVYILKYKTF